MHELKGRFRKFGLSAVLVCGLCACDGRDQPMQLGEERAGHDDPEVADRLIEVIKRASLRHYPAGEVKRFNQAKGLAR